MANNNDLFEEFIGEFLSKVEVVVYRMTMKNAADGLEYFIGIDDDGAIVLANQEDAFVFRNIKEMSDFISKSKIEPSAVEGSLTLKNEKQVSDYFNGYIIDANSVSV